MSRESNDPSIVTSEQSAGRNAIQESDHRPVLSSHNDP